MPLSRNYRWVLVSELIIKNESKVPSYEPKFSFEEVNEELKRLVTIKDTDYFLENESKKMSVMQIKQIEGDFLGLLVSRGDKNIPDSMYENFIDGAIRSFDKKDDEGEVFTSHILISKEPGSYDNHLMLIESVPGITNSQVQRYLRYLFNKEKKKTYKNNEGVDKEYRPLFDIVGYQSNTLREALTENVLQDIELVKYDKIGDGIDEVPYVKEEIQTLKFVVKREIETNTEDSFFRKILNRFRQGQFKEMRIRIKTPNNQTKTTIVDTAYEDSEVLSQAFICSELVNNFQNPLKNASSSIKDDMIEKLLEIAKKYKA